MSRLLLLLAASLLSAADLPPGLMPAPEQITLASGRLALTADFAITAGGYRDERLLAAIARLRDRIARQTGLPLLAASSGAGLTVECKSGAPRNPTLGEDESYTLEVTTGGARLTAPTVTGAMRGMATVAQLIAADGESFYLPAVSIQDRPRFPWRGLMLDSARHWMPVPVVERNLEAMAAVKLNVLHWHLSEDQGIRVESKHFELLNQKGSDGLYYTQAQIRHIVDFARDRGIRVVPEFDVPGHTTAWFVGYPDLASAPGPYSIERAWGIMQPVMDVTQDKVYQFLDAFFGEMIALFPDEYFHIGGDEVLDNQWKANPKIQEFMQRQNMATGHELQAYFNRRLQTILKKHNRKMVGWDEILQPALPNDIVVQSWRGQESLADGANKGFRGILSFGYYLDHLRTAAFHYANDPLGGKAEGLEAAAAARILGGEACMWSEYVTAENVDSRTWPRTAAIAERFWSPRETTDVESMYARMEVVSRGLEWTGVQHRAYTAPALDRLAGGPRPAALDVLAAVVEANRLDLLRRHKFTSRVALNRLVDAVPPESETVRRVELLIRGSDTARLRGIFTVWRDNDAHLARLLESRFLLKEVAPLSRNLSAAATIALEALDYREAKQAPPAGWMEQRLATLNQLDQPQADLTLAAVRAVRLLVEQTGRAQ